MGSAEKQVNLRGSFVLENSHGQTVRCFRWDGSEINVVYRRDTRRVETVADLAELDEQGIAYDLLATTTPEKIMEKPLDVGHGRGRIEFIHQIGPFSENHDLAPEANFETKAMFGWSFAIQLGLAGILVIASALTGGAKTEPATTVTVVPQQIVDEMLKDEELPREKLERVQETPAEERRVSRKNIVVAPSAKRLTRHSPIPTHSTSMKRHARLSARGPRGGGYTSNARRGYGTNERYMNQIGALGALNDKRVNGGNGGRGGVNLRAVGFEPGSGAGGKGYGGFGNNGGGGRGLGGLGTGHGMGLANSMYGKGLVAAPFGDGSPAPGSGGYGTRGRAGGGEQGAGYGTTTVVGSWKGTGPKGDGPAGSGVGNGYAHGSPYGTADGDDDDAIVTGGLDRDQIAQVIMRNLGQITYCYEQGLQKQPALKGRVTVHFQIGGRGRVEIAQVAHSSVRSAQVEGCIVSKLRNWVFPKPQGGVSVAVTYPFLLRRVTQR